MILLYVLLITAQGVMCLQTDGFRELLSRSDMKSLGICISASVILYFMPLVLYMVKLAVLTQENHKMFTRLDCSYTLVSIFILVLTLVLFNMKSNDVLFGCTYNKVCNSLHDLVSMLIWLRTFPLLIIGSTWLYMLMRYCFSGLNERVHSTGREVAAVKGYLE